MRRRRRPVASLVLLAVVAVALLPVPWMHRLDADPAGGVWKLDGRLSIDGRIVDPPGRWSWLTVGRPPLVAEVVHGFLAGERLEATDLRQAPMAHQPAINEPVAVAVGRQAAGVPLELGIAFEAWGALRADVPDPALLVELNGVTLQTRQDWEDAVALQPRRTVFTTADGATHVVSGSVLPYQRARVVDLPPEGLQAGLAGRYERVRLVRWIRSLALGRSHGLVVALAAYVDASGDDLARGRHVAATGSIQADGQVGPIGGLVAKATAARRAGVDVLLFPAEQAEELEGFDPGAMRLIGVSSLAEAITALGER